MDCGQLYRCIPKTKLCVEVRLCVLVHGVCTLKYLTGLNEYKHQGTDGLEHAQCHVAHTISTHMYIQATFAQIQLLGL